MRQRVTNEYQEYRRVSRQAQGYDVACRMRWQAAAVMLGCALGIVAGILIGIVQIAGH